MKFLATFGACDEHFALALWNAHLLPALGALKVFMRLGICPWLKAQEKPLYPIPDAQISCIFFLPRIDIAGKHAPNGNCKYGKRQMIARLPKEEEQKSEEAAQAAPEDAKEAVESRPIPKKKGYRIRQEFQEDAQVEELSRPEEE